MIRPAWEEITRWNREGVYRCVPVSTRIPTQGRTPLQVLSVLRNVSEHCYLLESAARHDSWGRYTFLGYDPQLEITCLDGRMRVGELTFETDEPDSYISQVIEENKSPRLADMPPFTGGLVGYFSYDFLKYAEKSLRLDAEDTEHFKDVDLMLFDRVIAFDNLEQEILLIANMKLGGDIEAEYNRAVLSLRHMEELILTGKPKKDEPGHLTGEVRELFDRARYVEMVEKAKAHIFEGDIFQIVLSNRLEAPFAGTLLGTYQMLRTVNPSPYMFYLASSDLEAAGASPETLVKLEDGVLHTFPLAGTRPRGRDAEEDEALERQLLSDPKELAEHSMLVDLGRNDLGKISDFGTVEVEEAYHIQRYSHVMHIGSTVRGQIRKDKKAMDAIMAVLPAGTLSGAPKIRACQLINDLENCKRGIYGGAVGYIGFTGNMDTCIGIRLAYKKNGKVFVRSGAGIVADSVPEKEYQECVNKAAAVVKSLESSARR